MWIALGLLALIAVCLFLGALYGRLVAGKALAELNEVRRDIAHYVEPHDGKN